MCKNYGKQLGQKSNLNNIHLKLNKLYYIRVVSTAVYCYSMQFHDVQMLKSQNIEYRLCFDAKKIFMLSKLLVR